MMTFDRIQGVLHAEHCSLEQVAQEFGTPLYVYSKAAFEKHYNELDKAFSYIDHQICYAVKSNSNLAVLNVLSKLGAGFDIVTGGELARVIAAGGDPKKLFFQDLVNLKQIFKRLWKSVLHVLMWNLMPNLIV